MWSKLSLGRGVGVDFQGMYVGLHERPQRCVDQAVALDTALTLEVIGYDRHFEMARTVSGARMPRVEVALVLDLEVAWGKSGFESIPDNLNALRGHGSTRLNGLTLTLR